MEKSKIVRLLIATGLGIILGIFCIIGQSQRMPGEPLPNATIYLISAWYNRVIMGILIGSAEDWTILKQNGKTLVNAVLRGGIIGAIVSASFGLFQQEMALIYFFAGIVWGIINDTLTTFIILKKFPPTD